MTESPMAPRGHIDRAKTSAHWVTGPFRFASPCAGLSQIAALILSTKMF